MISPQAFFSCSLKIAKIIQIMHIVEPRMEGNSEAMSTIFARTDPENIKIFGVRRRRLPPTNGALRCVVPLHILVPRPSTPGQEVGTMATLRLPL
jgi:hypothetical protein